MESRLGRIRWTLALLGLVAGSVGAQQRVDRTIAQDPAYRLPPPEPQRVQAAPALAETLQTVWQKSIAADDRLSAHRWQTAAAETSLSAAHAGRIPTAHLQGGYQLRDNERRFISNLPGMPNFMLPYQQRENGSFSANVRVPLYTSGRISHQVAAADATVRSQQANVGEYRLQLKLDVAGEYISVLLAKNNLEVARSSTRSLAAHAQEVRNLLGKGKVPRNDLLAAEVALANGRYEQIQATHRLDRSQSRLNRRLRRPLDQPIQLQPPVVGQLDLELSQLAALAESRRPELASLAAQVEALEHQACSEQARNRVQVTLEGGYAFEENRYQNPQGITAAGIGISWNALNRKRDLRALSLRQKARAMASVQRETASRIRLSVREAWLHMREAQKRKSVTRQAVLHADENLRVTRRKYAMGTVTNTAVLQAESLRVQAYRNDNNASHDAVLAVLHLQRVVGTL